MSPFVNELIDIITDIFYLNKVSYPKYETHLETDHFIYSLLGTFTYHLFNFLKSEQYVFCIFKINLNLLSCFCDTRDAEIFLLALFDASGNYKVRNSLFTRGSIISQERLI